MATNEKPDWPRDDDEQWAAEVELRLVLDHHAPAGLADEVLAEAYEAVVEAARPARDLFGPPARYAQSAADLRIDEAYRAGLDRDGMTPGERLTTSLAWLGMMGTAVSVLYWIRNGLWVEPSWESIAGLTSIVLAACAAPVAIGVWSAGRVKGAWACAAGAAATAVTGLAAAAALPDERLLALPIPVATMACIALIAAAAAFPNATIDRWLRPTVEDDERWLSHLEGLLRGRHTMTAAEARDHAREARSRLAASDVHAEAAFGSAEIHAMRLARGVRGKVRSTRRKSYGAMALTALLLLISVDEFRDPAPSRPMFWFHVTLVAYWFSYAIRLWRRASSANREGKRD
ncbi:hypothetical protein AB0C51_05055 [Streptomyces pathocidini]|uniref:hypothetical protein n=1 Tax=Streptomyces pathocidini TaxID=1650571 RepID=UPI0033CA5616